MENTLKRSEHKVEDELPTKQAKLEENEEEEANEEEEFLKPELACEIYAALPAAHQRRLLILCRHIFELGPSTDEFTKWKILKWTANCWKPKAPNSRFFIHVSPNGLNVSRNENDGSRMGIAHAMHGVQFPPTQLEGPQVCYFEVKRIHGHFWIGFISGEPMNYLALCNIGTYIATTPTFIFQTLPNVRFEDDEVAVIGCGLVKQFGQRKVFFTKNGHLLAKPIPLHSTAPDGLVPFILSSDSGSRFEDTNFGLNSFLFKYKGNEDALSQEMSWE